MLLILYETCMHEPAQQGHEQNMQVPWLILTPHSTNVMLLYYKINR
jgi:hypothetical protein